MSDHNVLISAAILCYNQQQYIRQSIDSLVAQKTEFSFEIVIGDDGSTDGTREIAEEYAAKYPSLVRVLPKMPNKGLLLNYRDTLKSCRGKYLAFCAGDDYWNDPEKLQKQVSFLEKNPDYGLVHTDSNYYYEKENIFINNNRAGQKATITDGFVFEALLTRKFEISALTACYTKKYIDDFVDFEEFRRAGLAYEDYPTWLELSRHTKFKYLDESTATYRVIANSVSRPSDIKKKFSFLEDKHKIRRYFLEKYHVGKVMKERIEELYYLQKFDLAYKYRNKEAAVDSYAFLNKRGIADMKMKVKNILIGIPVLYSIVDKLNAIVKTKQSRLRSS